MPKIPDDRQIFLDLEYLMYKRPDLYRATMLDFDAMVELYNAARAEDLPDYAGEYSTPEQIREDIENGVLWYGVEDGEIIIACAVTPEPVFRRDWTLEMRYHTLPRLPGENWFRPGERYISLLRFAVRYGHRRRGLISEMCSMISLLANSCGIYEVRTRMNCERTETCKAIARMNYKLVGACSTPGGVKYYGFYRRNSAKYAIPKESKGYRPIEDDYDGDAYTVYDFAKDADEIARMEYLRYRYDRDPDGDGENDEDLMGDI